MDNSKRNWGVDLLRIILALMVITLHINAGATGGVSKAVADKRLEIRAIVGIVGAISYCAVNCYVIISAFFLYREKKGIKDIVNRLLKMWVTVVFYSIVGYIATVLIFKEELSIIELIKRFFPIIRGKWWFMTNYFAIMLFSPFLNLFIETMEKRKLKKCLRIGILVFTIYPFFVCWEDMIGTNYGYSLVWFVFLYLTGAYISKYSDEYERNSLKWGVRYIIMCILLFISAPILSRIPYLQELHFYSYNSIIVYMAAIYLFMTFYKLEIKGKKARYLIKNIAPLSLASYLVHCQEDIEANLWSALKLHDYVDELGTLFVTYLVTVCLIFVVSVLIECIRIKMLKASGLENKVLEYIKNILYIINKKINIIENKL